MTGCAASAGSTPGPRIVYAGRLPFPPSVNTYWRSVVIKGRVRVLLSKDGREYKEKVQAAIRCGFLFEGRAAVEIVLHPPTRRAFDIDNFVKALLDSLTEAGVWSDDSQVDSLFVKRGDVVRGGAVDVVVYEES